jgi:hypothetical protein
MYQSAKYTSQGYLQRSALYYPGVSKNAIAFARTGLQVGTWLDEFAAGPYFQPFSSLPH